MPRSLNAICARHTCRRFGPPSQKAQAVFGDVCLQPHEWRAGCANTNLTGDILRGEWGFNGYVVSDCGAIDDIYQRHHFLKTEERLQRWP